MMKMTIVLMLMLALKPRLILNMMLKPKPKRIWSWCCWCWCWGGFWCDGCRFDAKVGADADCEVDTKADADVDADAGSGWLRRGWWWWRRGSGGLVVQSVLVWVYLSLSCFCFVCCKCFILLYMYVYPLMLVHYCYPVSLDLTHHCCGIHSLGFKHNTAARTPALCPGTLLLLGQFLQRVLHTVAGTGLVPNCARPASTAGPHTTAVGQPIFLTQAKLSQVSSSPVSSRGAHPQGCNRDSFPVAGPPPLRSGCFQQLHWWEWFNCACQRNIWHIDYCLFDITLICGARRGAGACFALFTSYPGIAISTSGGGSPPLGDHLE